MGYYSAIALAIHKGDEHQLAKRIGCLNNGVFNQVCKLFESADKSYSRSNEDYVVYYWNSVKWYENIFIEVDFIMDFIKRLKYPYDFIRIGEDFDDTTIHNEAQVIEAHRIISIS